MWHRTINFYWLWVTQIEHTGRTGGIHVPRWLVTKLKFTSTAIRLQAAATAVTLGISKRNQYVHTDCTVWVRSWQTSITETVFVFCPVSGIIQWHQRVGWLAVTIARNSGCVYFLEGKGCEWQVRCLYRMTLHQSIYVPLRSTTIHDPTRELYRVKGETALWEQHEHVQADVCGPHHPFNKYSFVH